MAKHSLLPVGTEIELLKGIHKGKVGTITGIFPKSQHPYDISIKNSDDFYLANPSEVKEVK